MGWFPYDISNLRGDLFGGVTAGINAWVNLNVPLTGDIPEGFPEIRLAEWTFSGMESGLLIKLVRFLTMINLFQNVPFLQRKNNKSAS